MHKLTRVTSSAVRQRQIAKISTSSITRSEHGDIWYGPEKAAGREVVGYGHNGDMVYMDRLDRWFPAIRFRKADDTYNKLNEKQKGDWKNLTLEEKKLLYRYNFMQTHSELIAKKGYWKLVLSYVFYGLFMGSIAYFGIHHWGLPNPPPTFNNEYKEAMLARMIDLRGAPATGPSSKWDYEKNAWKS